MCYSLANTNIFTLLLRQLKINGKSFIFADLRNVTLNLSRTMEHRAETSESGARAHNLGRKRLSTRLAQSLFFSFLPYIPIESLFIDFRMDHLIVNSSSRL